jgi:hypothetical protein
VEEVEVEEEEVEEEEEEEVVVVVQLPHRLGHSYQLGQLR